MTGTTTTLGQQVVVGVDGSESSVRAAVYAAEQARRRGAPLHVVPVTPQEDDGRPTPMGSHESATLLVEAAADAVRQATGMTEVSHRWSTTIRSTGCSPSQPMQRCW